jgi:hypothetical protein
MAFACRAACVKGQKIVPRVKRSPMSQFLCFENVIFAGVPKVVEQRPATGIIQAHKCLLTLLRGNICLSVNV